MTTEERDIQLTAYALGELPPAETAEVEARLTNDEQARRTVDEVRLTAGLLRHELAAEAHDQSTLAQPYALERSTLLLMPQRRVWTWGHRWVIGALTAAAACVGLAYFLPRFAGESRVRQIIAMGDRPVVIPPEIQDAAPPTEAPKNGDNRLPLDPQSAIVFRIPEVENSVEQASELAYTADRDRFSKPIPAATSQTASPTFTITGVEGKVQMALREGEEWQSAVVGLVVEPTSLLRTGTRSAVRVTSSTGEIITIDRMGTVRFARVLDEQGRVKSNVDLAFGLTRYEVEAGGIEEDQSINKPGNTLVIRGTKMNIPDDGSGLNEVHKLYPRFPLGRRKTSDIDGKLGSIESDDLFSFGGDIDQDMLEGKTGEELKYKAKMFGSGSATGFGTGRGTGISVVTKSGDVDPIHFHHTESYARIHDNAFLAALDSPLSTFSIDVDTASYANVRRFLTSGKRPPPDAVRIEEMLNYFDYAYSGPADEHPFAAHVEVNQAPWNPRHRLVRIGIKGREIAQADRPAANLVFLIDVSGSMKPANKLPLLREAMKMLVSELRDDDRVAMVVYAGSTGLVLDSTPAAQRQTILDALDRLAAGGSTNGGAGIQLAYDVAVKNFVKEGGKNFPGAGINRVILCTDGDFNVGVTSEGDLTRLIEEKAKTGVFLTVLGFGISNLKDGNLEKLADKGNGNYGYIDTLNEARKMLIEQMGGTLVTIAKDVKIQVEFNPAKVASYRLIGYENRVLAKEDFNNDLKDAGEIGAGHTVTALYEVVPVGVDGEQMAGLDMNAAIQDLERQIVQIKETMATTTLTPEGQAQMQKEIERLETILASIKARQAAPPVDPLKYQKPAKAPAPEMEASDELLTLKLRYKAPDAPLEQGVSTLIEFPVKDEGRMLDKAGEDYRFAAAVAGFGMLLRDSPHKGDASYEQVLDLAGGALGDDRHGYRHEFITLVETAKRLPAKP